MALVNKWTSLAQVIATGAARRARGTHTYGDTHTTAACPRLLVRVVMCKTLNGPLPRVVPWMMSSDGGLQWTRGASPACASLTLPSAASHCASMAASASPLLFALSVEAIGA